MSKRPFLIPIGMESGVAWDDNVLMKTPQLPYLYGTLGVQSSMWKVLFLERFTPL